MAYINNIDNKFLNLQISQLMLKKLIQYAVYPSKRVSKKDKRNLQELINSISYETSYEESQVNERYSFKFLRELINMVVDGYSDIEVVANYFMEKEGKIDGYPTEVLNTILSWIQIAVENEGLFNDSDLKMMRDFISNRLQYLFIFKSLPEINRSAERLNNESVDIKSIVDTTTPLIKKLDIDLRRSKYVNEDRFLDTSIGARQNSDRDRDLDSLQEIIQASRNKDAKLISGYRSLNKIINGGFAKDRVYVFSAVPKHFKSGTLLNIAVSVARNNALMHVKGEFYMFVDSDDWLDPETCAVAYGHAKQYDADCLMFSYTKEFGDHSIVNHIFDEDCLVWDKKDVKQKFHRRLFGPIGKELAKPQDMDIIVTPCMQLFRTDKYSRIPFIDIHEVGTFEDGLYQMEVYNDCERFVYIDRPFYHYLKTNDGSITTRYKADLSEKFQHLWHIIENNIEKYSLGKEYQEALSNRVALSMIGLGLNEIKAQRGFAKSVLGGGIQRGTYQDTL